MVRGIDGDIRPFPDLHRDMNIDTAHSVSNKKNIIKWYSIIKTIRKTVPDLEISVSKRQIFSANGPSISVKHCTEFNFFPA